MGRTKSTDYSKLVIYKIKCNDESILDFYVGSTTLFKSRKNRHKVYATDESKKEKIYETIRANGGWENWSMVEIEIYPCNSSTEARIREEYWRVELQATLNMIKSFGAETRQEYMKIYEQEHKEERKQYLKQYREEHKEERKEYLKQYRDENKEEIKIKESKYREEHKEKIKEKIECKCGAIIRKGNKSHHETTQKHILAISKMT